MSRVISAHDLRDRRMLESGHSIVVHNIFSGRRSPQWYLSPAQTRELEAKLEQILEFAREVDLKPYNVCCFGMLVVSTPSLSFDSCPSGYLILENSRNYKVYRTNLDDFNKWLWSAARQNAVVPRAEG